MIAKAFIHHKRAEKYSDCQDCFGINTQNNRIAVSDGMSQSIFPQWWAKILVDEYLEKGALPHHPQDMLPLQQKWQQMLYAEIQEREKEARTDPRRNPWRLKNLLAERSGAGATLCGLTLGNHEWTCECLGDSCVITINHDYGLNIYTSQVGEFSDHPDYFDSFGKGRGKPIKITVNRDVKAVLMVSDPFAELFQLNQNNRDFIKSRFDELQTLTTHESFTEMVERWRDDFGMHNDDSTLVFIEDVGNPGLTVQHGDDLENLCAAESSMKIMRNSAETISSENRLVEANVSSEEAIPLKNESQEITFEEAKRRFIRALELLLTFYSSKKKPKIKHIQKWLTGLANRTIKNFLNK